MTETICRSIFQGIYENKWLSIEYKNEKGAVTRYWIGIRGIDIPEQSLLVEGMHLNNYATRTFKIYISSICNAVVVEGTFYQVPEELKEDIHLEPQKYQWLFGSVPNLKILNYLADCNRLDHTPYKMEYTLIDHLDGTETAGEGCHLSDAQFQELVHNFQVTSTYGTRNCKIKQIGMNVLSIHTRQGLYVMAYHPLRLDVRRRSLRQEEEIVICTEFTVNGVKQSIRQFLDADDYVLLEHIEEHLEEIKDRITRNNRQINGVDDMPYVIAIGRDVLLDLHREYEGITEMFRQNKVTIPIKAFFGGLMKHPQAKKDYPIALLNRKINLDQLLAIHNGMKYPLAYIQGPPGTGKTNTIINTLLTAFFNEKTVLFTSYNNHPIDGVYEKLQQMSYLEKRIPLPVIRLGNDDKIATALDVMQSLYEETQRIQVFDGTLERNKDSQVIQTRKLMELLERHEEKLDLLERKDTIEKLLQTTRQIRFQTELYGVQLEAVNRRLKEIGTITDEEAIALAMGDEEAFYKYLYYTSARYIKRLGEAKNKELLQIIYMDSTPARVTAFHQYLSKDENMKRFLSIFPLVVTTSISAHRLGEPKPYFDMVIMDEASQGNTAVSLVPVLRGKKLMLVGDPQQLSPVILLDARDNAKLRKMYQVPMEYDYIENSIYKTFLACDAVSEEILLSHHYRCHKKIIDFNNQKYYNNKLIVDTRNDWKTPLLFVDIPDDTSTYRNQAPREAEEILAYAKAHEDQTLGVITPFFNQKKYIQELLQENGLHNVTCGTVHAFQGDEKDVILFSMGVTNRTSEGTYEWLKNNKELINVATSRAKNQLIILSSKKELERLHKGEADDVYELVQYVSTQGTSEVTPRVAESRALGVKPYTSEIESAFLANLNHALGNVLNTEQKCVVKKEVAIRDVFGGKQGAEDVFGAGRFDFVVYEQPVKNQEVPILAIELEGREHRESSLYQKGFQAKRRLCQSHGLELISIGNSYARRYNHVKEILIQYFREA